MIDVKIVITGAFLKDPDKAGSVFFEIVYKAMLDIVMKAEYLVKSLTPVNDNILRGSMGHEISGVGINLEGIIGTPVEYASCVEEDQVAHWPPPEDIELWTKRKFKMSGLANKRLAYLVCRKIAKYGVEGKHMFKRTFDEIKPESIIRFSQAINEFIRRME
jgi:hypothetical protein